MLILALLTACNRFDGPKSALVDARHALDAGDLAAFEAVVDVDAVVPDIATACATLGLEAHLSEAQFRYHGGWAAITRDLGDSVVDGATDTPEERQQIADGFRVRFPELPTDSCPALAVDLSQASFAAVDADHVTASLPSDAAHGGAWVFTLTHDPNGWRVTGVDGTALIATYEAAELEDARVRAHAIVADLQDGGAHDDWLALANYVDNHPEDADLAAANTALLAPFDGVEPPVHAIDTGFFKPPGLFRNRFVGTRVVSDRAATEAIVRFTFEDGDGRPAISMDGARDIVLATGPVGPTSSQRVTQRAGGMSWPSAVRSRATVVEVTWEDGTIWQHPAVVAGAWSPIPTDVPVE
jgi:hypothetical protein